MRRLGHPLGREHRGARGRIDLLVVVELDDLRGLEVGRRQLGEAHHQHRADREVGRHEHVRPAVPALGGGGRRPQLVEVEAGGPHDRVDAGGDALADVLGGGVGGREVHHHVGGEIAGRVVHFVQELLLHGQQVHRAAAARDLGEDGASVGFDLGDREGEIPRHGHVLESGVGEVSPGDLCAAFHEVADSVARAEAGVIERVPAELEHHRRHE